MGEAFAQGRRHRQVPVQVHPGRAGPGGLGQALQARRLAVPPGPSLLDPAAGHQAAAAQSPHHPFRIFPGEQVQAHFAHGLGGQRRAQARASSQVAWVRGTK